MAEKGTLYVNTEGLLPIIKKWLYTEREIFLREIISNSYDAINKLKHLCLIGEYKGEETEYKIEVFINKDNKTISVKDNGIGLSYEEVKKYINQIAFSGAKEFVQKYTNIDKNSLIGFFGLGFYSSFIVSKKVEIISKSYREDEKPIKWVSDGTTSYELETLDDSNIKRGTTVTMYLDDESIEFIDKEKIKSIIKKYSNFLDIPIYIDNEKINYGEPLWAKDPKTLSENDYKEFFKECFGYKEPMFWIHFRTEYPFEMRGILYFPKIYSNLDLENGSIRLFVKNVFVVENIKEMLPDFLAGVYGVIDSTDIPLNVSRSQFQNDIKIKKISSYIVKKFGEEISEIYNKDKERFIKIWEDINVLLKYGAIKDEQFYNKIKDIIIFKDNNNEYCTINEYITKNKIEKDGKNIILYSDQKTPQLDSFVKTSGKNTIIINPIIDIHLFNFIESKENTISFVRFDSDKNPLIYSEIEVDKEKKDRIIEVFKKYLDVEVEVKNTNDSDSHLVILIDENMKRFSEISRFILKDQNIKNHYKILVNPNSHLVSKVLLLDTVDKEKAKKLAEHLRDLALLSSGLLEPELVKDFVKRSYEFIINI
ncbi:MAG TPA: molecular chaperone HtpG [Spirochaetota bacterium]|nr:molecular chaperone HtpG [Spirochaetota bacterium]HOM38752.1 molecular chaperone HtpG [Spirochaetota bacterium]HPQ49550.1 molecular chaperone HtpG [Spirochaetota bacterium]